MPIETILKPKSEKELSDVIDHMHPFQFVNKFRKANIRGWKIGWKKRILYFLAVWIPNHYNRFYWPYWSLWLGFTIGHYIWKDIVLLNNIRTFMGLGLLIFIIPATVSLILNIIIQKWNNNHPEYVPYIAAAEVLQQYLARARQEMRQQDLNEEEERRRQMYDQINRDLEQYIYELNLRRDGGHR